MHYAVILQNEVIKYNIYSVFVRISVGYLNSGDYLNADIFVVTYILKA